VDDRSLSQSCLSSRKVSYPFLSGRRATGPVQPLPTPEPTFSAAESPPKSSHSAANVGIERAAQPSARMTG
jgi:hypothetical protein